MARIPLCLWILICGLFVGGVNAANSAKTTPKHILLLLSYDSLHPGTTRTVQILRQHFKLPDVRLSVEYIDSEVLRSAQSLENYTQFLQSKLVRQAPFDLVISSRKDALQLLLDQRIPALQSVPLVFFGINQKTQMEAALQQLPSTGLFEAISFPETRAMAHRLFPDAKHLVVITDEVSDHHSLPDSFDSDLKRADEDSQVSFRRLSLGQLSWLEFEAALREIPPHSVLLLHSALVDKNGRRISFEEALSIIRTNSDLPVFHFWRYGLGEGVLGGVMVDMQQQARAAVNMAQKILQGTLPEHISPVWHSPNQMLADDSLIEYFEVPRSRLPAEIELVNQPEKWVSHYGIPVIVCLAVGIAVLLLVSAVLWANLLRRTYQSQSRLLEKSQQLLKDQETKYQAIFNQVPDTVMIADYDDHKFIEFNDRACEMLGYSREELLQMRLEDIRSDGSAEESSRYLEEIEKNGGGIYKAQIKTKSGENKIIRLSTKSILLGGKKYASGIFSDITKDIEKSKFLYMLFKITPVGILTFRENQIVSVNQFICDRFGYTESELIGASPDIIYPSIETLTNGLRDVSETGGNVEFGESEASLKTREGDEIVVLARYVWINPKKPQYGGVCTMMDITERKHNERELTLLAEVVKQSNDALLITDTDFHVKYVNPAFEAMSGYTIADLKNKWAGFDDAEQDHEAVLASVREDLQQNRVFYRTGLKRKRKNGSSYIGEVSGKAVKNQDNETIAILSWQRDITKRHEANRQLSRSENRYRTLLEIIPQGVVLMDSEGHIIGTNPAATRILGRELSGHIEAQFLDCKAVMYYEDGSEVPADQFPFTDTKLGHRNQVIGIYNPELKDYVWINIDVFAVDSDQPEQPQNLLAVFSDITESRTLQRAVVQHQRQEAVGELTGGIAHDFNNILASVLGFAELSRTRFAILDPDLERYLDAVISSGKRARDLVRQLLIFSRGDSTRGAESLDIADEIGAIITMLRPMFPATMELATNFSRPSPQVVMDPLHLQQLIINLSINARDAMKNEGQLEISTSLSEFHGDTCALCQSAIEGDWVEICVSDSGSGIEDQVLNHMFQPFTTTKDIGEGSGMGLPVVRGICETYRGHLIVETRRNVGSRFRVLLPCQIAPEAAPEISRAANDSIRILLVDDEEPILGYLKESLENKRFQVDACANADEAQAVFKASRDDFDAIVTDQSMPGMSGVRFIESIREMNRAIPVVLCSGKHLEEHEEVLQELNIAEVLLKPVQANDLIQILERLIVSESQEQTKKVV